MSVFTRTLAASVERYIALQQALGYQFRKQAASLHAFAYGRPPFRGHRDARRIRSTACLRWWSFEAQMQLDQYLRRPPHERVRRGG
jgi:hypothetical protein